jgi:hypothetical protein
VTTREPLPAAPTGDDVRALARSSPWRWRTVRFTATWTGELGRQRPVRAWVARPASLRVESLDGELVHAGVEQRSVGAVSMAWASDGMPARYTDDAALAATGAAGLGAASFGWGDPAAASERDGREPVLRPDGLVARRPHDGSWDVDAPMYQDYRWVAMLDPVELAEPVWASPDDRERATEITGVAVVDHHGRPAWEAVLRPLADYDPRCSCCPLLTGAAADARETEAGASPHRAPGFAYADAHRVRLDVGTGICVLTEEIGGSRTGSGHELVIEAVDEGMAAELFQEPRRLRWRS